MGGAVYQKNSDHHCNRCDADRPPGWSINENDQQCSDNNYNRNNL